MAAGWAGASAGAEPRSLSCRPPPPAPLYDSAACRLLPPPLSPLRVTDPPPPGSARDLRESPLPAASPPPPRESAPGGAFGAAPAHGSRWQVCDGPACETRCFPEFKGRGPEDMRLVNHSFGDGPLVQSQTSANPLIADDFAPPCGPPGGEDCHRGAVAVVARAVCLDPVRRS